MISTKKNHDTCLVDVTKKGKVSKVIKKPLCGLDYNEAKKGVDLSDQISSYYTALRRGIKWYRNVALELITRTAIVNSWTLHKNSAAKSLSLLEFRETLARALK